MKNKLTYILLIAFFFVVSAFVVVRYNYQQTQIKYATYPLLERKGAPDSSREWLENKRSVMNLINKISDNPKDTKSELALSTLYIKEARISGNYTYYDMAALKQVNSVLAKDSNNFQALTLKALLNLSQHHFAEGLEIAKKAQKLNSFNAYIYGLLIDANVEMGDYAAAVDNADKMVSIRPDLSSYSRISYLREIHGDYPGAVEAMKLAVQAGDPGDESTEWARIQLARLYENTGDLKSAQMHYMIALELRPGYGYANAGLGHIALATKDYPTSISYYEKAASSLIDNGVQEQLSQLYRLNGDTKKADEILKKLIDNMNLDEEKGAKDESIGHYSDRELAYAYLLKNDKENALKHALLEYNRRPMNIDVNQTVAWVYYKMKNYDKALPYLNTALKTNSKNPVLLCNAGLIYAAAGKKELAKATLTEALKNNPNIDNDLKTESLQVLKSI